MKLIYINFVGKNFRGVNIYEFLFKSEEVSIVTGEDWDSAPACGNPKPPASFTEAVYKIETTMELELIQNHESFNMDDCKQGVIAMSWESDDDFDMDLYNNRLFFSFGELKSSVEEKLYERDIHLEKVFENENENEYN